MPNARINLKKELENAVSENMLKVIYLCSEAADSFPVSVFLIGGAVRDVIIGKNHFDTDITVQGDALEFACFLEKKYPDICKIKEIHDKFGTAKLVFSINNQQIDIDVAGTRKETYPYPGSLPKVEEIGCELYEDVKRRDFSINSMALSINKNDFADLTDYLGGYDDIKNKKIRVLHPSSFIEDPTRIIRALKFRVRFDYELEESTKILQNKCLDSGMFDNFCGERIKSELKQAFNLNRPEIMEIFLQENIYKLVNKDINIPESVQNLAENCEKTALEYLKFLKPDFIWLIYLGVLLTDFSQEKIADIAYNLYLSGIETEILTGAAILSEKAEEIEQASSNYEIYQSFEGFLPEAILILLIKTPQLKEKINLHLKKFKKIKIYTTGQNLIDLGLKPGPLFGEILGKLLKAKINGEFSSKEEEKKFLAAQMHH